MADACESCHCEPPPLFFGGEAISPHINRDFLLQNGLLIVQILQLNIIPK
jgi:hypothetical protein